MHFYTWPSTYIVSLFYTGLLQPDPSASLDESITQLKSQCTRGHDTQDVSIALIVLGFQDADPWHTLFFLIDDLIDVSVYATGIDTQNLGMYVYWKWRHEKKYAFLSMPGLLNLQRGRASFKHIGITFVLVCDHSEFEYIWKCSFCSITEVFTLTKDIMVPHYWHHLSWWGLLRNTYSFYENFIWQRITINMQMFMQGYETVLLQQLIKLFVLILTANLWKFIRFYLVKDYKYAENLSKFLILSWSALWCI